MASSRDRHSRTGVNGRAKKGGAGGNYTWGKPGDEYTYGYIDEVARSSDSEDGIEEAFAEDTRPMSHEERVALFKRDIDTVVDEYLDSDDMSDILAVLAKHNYPALHGEAVKRAVSMSMDRNERARESVSVLLSQLYPSPLTMAQAENGFMLLLARSDDLKIDIPFAGDFLGAFIARAVYDEVLPPAFVDREDLHDSATAIAAVTHARTLLRMEHHSSKLAHIHGPGDGRPISELREAIKELVGEYLETSDVAEAERCIVELESAPFHHEVVFRLITSAIEGSAAARSDASALLSQLTTEGVVTETAVRQGLARVYGRLEDLRLDTPAAPSLLETVIESGKVAGWIPSDFAGITPPPTPRSESAIMSALEPLTREQLMAEFAWYLKAYPQGIPALRKHINQSTGSF